MKSYFLLILILVFCNALSAQNKQLDSLQLKKVVYNNRTSIKDQANSSTCWSFASNSFIESELMKRTNISYDLSEMFIARYSYIRKIKLHLKLKAANFFTPGGQFHDVQWVIKNYGMVPESAYSGLTDGKLMHDHADLDTVIKHFIEKALAEKKQTLSKQDSIFINTLLDKYLGKVPKTFLFNGKKIYAINLCKRTITFQC